MQSSDLIGLVGARLCHDIISPLGAIGNGLELLGLTGTVAGPEMRLIEDSVGNASARLRFFRVAFGSAAADQIISAGEIGEILGALSGAGRITYRLEGDEGLDRRTARTGFLAMLCAESAVPERGEVSLGRSAEGWIVQADADRIAFDAALWDPLIAGRAPDTLTSDRVQFALLALCLSEMGRTLQVDTAADRLVLRF